jgi:hypothetical protein
MEAARVTKEKAPWPKSPLTIQGIGASEPKRRAVADAMADEKTKKMMLRIANDYETMAQRAEQRLSDQNSISEETGTSQTAAKRGGKPL